MEERNRTELIKLKLIMRFDISVLLSQLFEWLYSVDQKNSLLRQIVKSMICTILNYHYIWHNSRWIPNDFQYLIFQKNVLLQSIVLSWFTSFAILCCTFSIISYSLNRLISLRINHFGILYLLFQHDIFSYYIFILFSYIW